MKAKESAVICRNLIKSYGEGSNKVVALRGVDLDVRLGEMMMLAGPSGCGKTTLISVIASILNQDSGECKVFGSDLNHLTKPERIAFRSKNIGFVFQSFNLFPTLTIAENVAIPLIIQGMDRHEATEKGAYLLEKMELGDRVNAVPADLSGGQQQRVAIARAMIHNPRLIVCDEPTSALDGDTGGKIMELVKKVALDESRALIVVTHDIRIFPFADRIAKMEDGHIIKIVKTLKEFEQ
jgi:putative ABC transport system ATP-binding protein